MPQAHITEQYTVSPITLWRFAALEDQEHNVGVASTTHMVGFSEGSVVAQQLLARTATRANRRPRAPQLKPKNCISNNLWRALSPPQERGGRGSSGLKSWFRRGFDRKVGMRRDWVGRWVVLGWLDCRQTGFTDRCLKHLLTTPGSTLIIRDVL